ASTNPGGFGGGSGGASASNLGGIGGGGAGLGGGIFMHSGTLTIINSTLTSNSALAGSAPSTAGGATNRQAYGGAIFNLNGAVTIINSTLGSNTAADGGGALYILSHGAANGIVAANATLTLQNTILADSISTSDLAVNQLPGAMAATVNTAAT